MYVECDYRRWHGWRAEVEAKSLQRVSSVKTNSQPLLQLANTLSMGVRDESDD